MEYVDLREKVDVVLAYLGDAVLGTICKKILDFKGIKSSKLKQKSKKCVNAKRQSVLYKEILALLEEEKYQQLGNRAKNGNIKTFS